ncbi:hypothetical protein ACWIG3_26705 [Streptomyces celluloflavus]
MLDCAEEVAEGPVGAGGVAGGIEVHEETTDDGEDTDRTRLGRQRGLAGFTCW